MKLSIKDRIIIPSIMPEGSKYIERLLIKGILAKTELTAEEIQQFEISETEKGVFWKAEKAIDIDIEFTKEELTILNKAAKVIDEKELVTNDNCELIGKLLNCN